MLTSSPMDILQAANPRDAGRSGSRNVEDMGSEDFMALMIAQMENQDPTTYGSASVYEPAGSIQDCFGCSGAESGFW